MVIDNRWMMGLRWANVKSAMKYVREGKEKLLRYGLTFKENVAGPTRFEIMLPDGGGNWDLFIK